MVVMFGIQVKILKTQNKGYRVKLETMCLPLEPKGNPTCEDAMGNVQV